MTSGLLILLDIYVLLGLLVAVGFVLLGVSRVDPVAADSSFVFRLVIFPGCVGLWPVVLMMWIRAAKGGQA